MKKYIATLFCLLLIRLTTAQTIPALYTWVRNLTGATGYNSIPSNVQSIYYTSTDVYISCTCIPGYSIGPWSGNPNVASNQNFCFKITRSPVQNTGTATSVGNGHIGVWTNGVSIFNVSDAMSYNNQGIWFRNAYYWEGSGFDNCLGHPQQQGEYHHHVSPKCLYDPTDSTHHSPIIGYAFDGFPVYGAYGYANANGTGGIKRMTPSYAVSAAATRVNGPAVSATYPAGCFIQDYIYTANSGDLDARNGRFCITPEYPSGIYAYFVTINSSLTPVFPYTFYGTYYGVVQTGNTGNGGHNTIPGTATQYTTPFVPTISISASSTTICSGMPVTFTPAVTNGGTSPSYQWKKNNVNVATGNSYTTSSLTAGDSIICVVTSNANYLTAATAISNAVVMTVSANVTPSVSISTASSTVCSGSKVIFNAAAVNGGSAPSYQWNKNGINAGAGASTYADSTLSNGDSITCMITSNASCVTSATATSNSLLVMVKNSPAISGFSPVSGSTGNTIIISGSHFGEATSVSFNGAAASFVINNDGQITATVPSSASTGLISVTNTCGTAFSSAAFTFIPLSVTLNVKLLIAGFYAGNGQMKAVADPVHYPSLCDTVTIQLKNSTGSHATAYSTSAAVDINGNGTFLFPAACLGNSYYIVIRHRSALETWSTSTVAINSSVVTYDFTTNNQN